MIGSSAAVVILTSTEILISIVRSNVKSATVPTHRGQRDIKAREQRVCGDGTAKHEQNENSGQRQLEGDALHQGFKKCKIIKENK